jgi:hypothetical protein
MWIGIDPGVSGGIAVIGDEVCATQKLDATEGDISGWLWHYHSICACRAIIERVGAFPAKGTADGKHAGQGVVSAFRFGQSYGFLRGLLIAHGIPFEEVSPVVWQRSIGILKVSNEGATAKKNRHKAKAQQLFPNVKCTHANSDALLLAEFLRRREGGGCGGEKTIGGKI